MSIRKAVFITAKYEIHIAKNETGKFELTVYNIELGYKDLLETYLLKTYGACYLYAKNKYLSEESKLEEVY